MIERMNDSGWNPGREASRLIRVGSWARGSFEGRCLLLGVVLVCWLGLGGAAQAQLLHLDVSLQENDSDNRLSIHAYDWNVEEIVPDVRAYVRSVGISGNSLITDAPGFAAITDPAKLDPFDLLPVVGNQDVYFNVLSPPISTMPELGGRNLSHWDGDFPINWQPKPDPDEGIKIFDGSILFPDPELDVDGAIADLEGFSAGSASGSGFIHNHLQFLLLPDNGELPEDGGPDDGVYLMLLEVGMPSYSEWIPIFVGIAAFVGGDTVHRAVEDAINNDLLFPLCSDGIDNDKDGTIDLADAGCEDAEDMSERGAVTQCDNGIDDDGDGLVDFHDLDGDGVADFPGDDGCLHPTNLIEAPEPGFMVGLAWGVAMLAAAARRSSTREPKC